MDVATLSMNLNQIKVAQKVGVSVMKMSMDTMIKQSEEMTKMMEQSVNPHIGSNIDTSV